MTEEVKKARHKATFARDKMTGGYLVRVNGPQANMFAGREVPVQNMAGEVKKETLERLVWTGVDDGSFDKAWAGQPVALYTFVRKEKEKIEPEF